MLKLGSTAINKIYLGATEINKAYLGSTVVYDQTGGGGGSDVTPDAVDWVDISFRPRVSFGQITGIDTDITLDITIAPADSNLYSIDYWITTNSTATESQITANGTRIQPGTLSVSFTVSNNEYVHFFVGPQGPKTTAGTVTITNASDGDTVLDTFDWSVQGA